MNDITFFCLCAKIREAQKKYFKEIQKSGKTENAKYLLIQSKELEKYLDKEIFRRINEKVYSVAQMQDAWKNFKPE